jgi:riboflavin synthase
MFSGVIEELGQITEARKGLLKVRVTKIRAGTKLGDSIAVGGVDLTVAQVTEKTLSFNVMPETYRRSALGRLRRGSRVNLERSIRAIDRLSGHLVRGVIEGIGTLKARRDDDEAIVLTFVASRDLLANMVVRGRYASME